MEIKYLQDKQFQQQHHKKVQQEQSYSTLQRWKALNQPNKDTITQNFTFDRRKKNPLGLKEILLKTKVDILTKNFIRKLKRGKVFNQLPQTIQRKQLSSINILGNIIKFLSKNQGIELSPMMLCIWSFINIIQISIMVIIFSIMIAFPQTQDLNYFVVARIFSVFLYGIDMTLNFITQRHQLGGHKKNLKDIMYFYLTNEFTPDFFSIFIFPLSYAFKASDITPIIMLIALFKLKNNLKRFEQYEFIYVKTNTREQYYSLIKVFVLNFSIAHILSIFLNLMANLSPKDDSWLAKHNIQNAEWIVKYVWGYYWGTTIMLTVGFGDFSANNQMQALTLIFIQTMSCITLAYNISCVGAIIGEMKAQTDEKKKRLKYFHRMCEENKISEELEQKINHFIEQSYLIKEEFELEKYESVINLLPKSMQSEYRKEANKSLFEVGFFNSLNSKTIMNLAELVIRKVAHPEQVIQKKGEVQNFCILQKGCLGFTYKNGPKSELNGTSIETFEIDKGSIPKILSLGFVKRRILQFDIKSVYYSIYYYLTYEQFMKTLQTCEMDYQFFLYMKDRDDNILGSNEISKCKVCFDDYHTLFECPKYHYMPIKQIVISNYLLRETLTLNERKQHPSSRQYRQFKALINKKILQAGQQIYYKQNYDENQVKQIKNIKKYYYQKLADQMEYKKFNSIDILNERTADNPLQQQINKLEDILTKAASKSQDFWSIQSDCGYNFSYYFKEYNPNRLHSFKLFPQKKKGKQTGFGVFVFKASTKSKMGIKSGIKPVNNGTNLGQNFIEQMAPIEFIQRSDYQVNEE